jgi:dihydroorotate dehydrogenase (fumarate)
MVRSGSLLQRVAPIRGLLHGSFAYEDPTVLRQTVAGLQFNNPVGLSAGLDKNFELVPIMKAVGFGFMEGGSLTLDPCVGNARPWFHRLPKTKSIVVHVGLANYGVARGIHTIRSYKPSLLTDFPLNISVAKTNSPGTCTNEDAVADYVGSLEQIKSTGVGDMYTLNISCPNTFGGEPFTDPERLEMLLSATDALELTKPLFIKMPIDLDWKSFKALLAVADNHQVTGVTIGNLAKDRSKVDLKDPLSETVKGNLSGKPTQKLSDALIGQTYKAYGKRFIIIGVGGIFTAQDAYAKIKNGATLVEMVTGLIFQGPQVIGQINRDLAGLIKADGYNNVSEVIGTAVS